MTMPKKPNFPDLLLIMQGNMCPAMEEDLARQLGPGVTAQAVRTAGVGYYPKEQCWIFPERDGDGNVIGLLKRFPDGKKFTWKESKRGLSYDPVGIRQKDSEVPEYRPQFIRVGDAGVPCPICGRERDGCLVSDEDPEDPAVVICVRTPAGAERCLEGAGYFHRRHAQSDYRGGAVSVLPLSDRPVVVTEGASDRLVATALGYVAVGRPSAESCPKGLASFLQGRDVILVGDRDGHGVGQRGLESAFQTLRESVRSIVKVLPPEGKGKDLRAWHPTREEFEAHVAAAGDKTDDGSVLADTAPLALVKSWIQETHTRDGVPLLRRVHGDYYRWEGTVYRKLDQEEVRGQWYAFFTDRKVKVQAGDGIKITTLRPDRKFCADLQDAASAYCSVRIEDGVHEPFLIQARAPMDLTRAVVFQNGILYIADDRLTPLSPEVFLTSTLPYDYRPSYLCPLWEWFVGDVFNGDQECVDLLQEWFGYNLIASNHMQSMMFLFGVPGSGKSTTAGVLQSLLGGARCCGASTDNFKGLFGKETLLNKYAAIMSESRDTNRSDIDKLLQTWKAITGGDVINVARKYKAAVDARLFCRLTYVANEAIPFDDVSQAMANRMNLLYFPNNYRKKTPDRMLEHKLKQELPGIALWSIQGLKRLLANDKFTMPAASHVQLAQLAELTNPVGLMLTECTELHIGSEFTAYQTECNVLYDLWKAWCDETRTKTSLSAIGFGMKLTHLERPITRRRIEEAGKRMYVYQGLEIKPGIMEQYLKR
jgi:putative DNA primase/helicase